MPRSLHLDPCRGPVRLFSCSLLSKESNQQLKVTHVTQAGITTGYFYEHPQNRTFFSFLFFILDTNAAASLIALKLSLMKKMVYLAICLQPTAKMQLFLPARGNQ